jgi:hypothetical protein
VDLTVYSQVTKSGAGRSLYLNVRVLKEEEDGTKGVTVNSSDI